MPPMPILGVSESTHESFAAFLHCKLRNAYIYITHTPRKVHTNNVHNIFVIFPLMHILVLMHTF